MQAAHMDISLRDPGSEIARKKGGAFSAGLVDPDAPIYYTEDEMRRLRIRKKLEYELILSLDKSEISPRKECWYLVDSNWLNQWASFTHIPSHIKVPNTDGDSDSDSDNDNGSRRYNENSQVGDIELNEMERGSVSKASASAAASIVSASTGAAGIAGSKQQTQTKPNEPLEEEDNDPPGPISSKALVDDKGIPLLPDLLQSRDYRGVPAISYWCFVELYGKDDSPDIPRYQVDLYKPTVPVGRLVNIQFKAKQEAKLAVASIRPKWIKWELSDDEEEDPKNKNICCGLTKDHFEAFIWWFVRCCFISRRKDGRGAIKYSQYAPMRYAPGDSTHGLDSSHGSSSNSSHGMNTSGRGIRVNRGGGGALSDSSTRGNSRINSSHGGRIGVGSMDDSNSFGSMHDGYSSHSHTNADDTSMGDGNSINRHKGSSHGGRGVLSGSKVTGRDSMIVNNPLHSSSHGSGSGSGTGLGDGTTYADRGYESGSWVRNTVAGSWLKAVGL